MNSAACVDVARNKITHKLAHGELIETEPWLKDGPITIGTAFKCTPTRMCSPKMLFRLWHSTPALHGWSHETKDKSANVGGRCEKN